MAENNLIAKTGKGKEIRLAPANNVQGFELKFYPGGQMPKDLKGVFTSRKEAEKVVQAYLAKSKTTSSKTIEE